MSPLAEILRPTTLDNYIGQQHLVGPGAVLRTLIESGNIPSMIFWGPPGIGKTTLAMIISNTLGRPFYTLSAISSGVKEVREVIDKAKSEEGSILFIDEIHRFNKSQQDSLLGAVERGIITLIGATTENPSFEVNSALLSRCQVYILKEFGREEMEQLIASAVKHYKSEGIDIEVQESEALLRISGGDARKLLNAIELVVNRTIGRTDVRTGGCSDRRTDGQTDVRTVGCSDRRMFGQTDRRTDGQTDVRTVGTSEHPNIQKSENPKIQTSENPNIRTSEHPKIRKSENPNIQTSENPNIQTSENPNIQTSEHPNIRTSEHPKIILSNDSVTNVIQQNLALYDRQGEMHYDIISAFIKSMRGSDPNGAVYWLARMIEGGEDPVFIARRMLIFASEDISNANPNALLLANACFEAVTKIGYPECRITLSQCAIYLANSAKSNSTYMALNNAQQAIRRTGDLPVPLHIRNAPTKLMKQMGYSDGYKYAHDYPGNFVEQEFLPDALRGSKFYEPGDNARENETRKLLQWRWKQKYGY